MLQMLVIIPYVERFGAGMLLTLRVLLSEWCVCALERASWCRWNAAARCWCRVCLLSEWCVQCGTMLVALRVQVLPEGDD